MFWIVPLHASAFFHIFFSAPSPTIPSWTIQGLGLPSLVFWLVSLVLNTPWSHCCWAAHAPQGDWGLHSVPWQRLDTLLELKLAFPYHWNVRINTKLYLILSWTSGQNEGYEIYEVLPFPTQANHTSLKLVHCYRNTVNNVFLVPSLLYFYFWRNSYHWLFFLEYCIKRMYEADY